MAIVSGPIVGNTPELFRGTVDLYKWRGYTCARKWPTYTKRPPTDMQAYFQWLFSLTSRTIAGYPTVYQEAHRLIIPPKGRTGLDVMRHFTRAYFKLVYPPS
jgi:hypothetical protein